MLFHMIYNMTHKNLKITVEKIIKYKFMKNHNFHLLNVFVCFVICYFGLILKLSMEWRGSLDQNKS